MLLRSLSGHLKNQNWFAVGLDFLIVVFGIFIGFQLNIWNENRKLDEAYVQARTRLAAETQANIDAVQSLVARTETSLTTVRGAIGVLRTCAGAPEDEALLLEGLNLIRGTQSLRLRESALRSMTSNEALLSRQPEAERERLGEFHRALLRTQELLDFLERLPLETPVSEHPAVGMAELETRRLSDAEWDVLEYRPLILIKPVSALCSDPAFSRSFYEWERAASFQILRARQFKAVLQQNQAALEEPAPR